MAPKFEMELRELLNRWSAENTSDTPDFILAQYINDCLIAYDRAVNKREVWYGRKTEEPVDHPFGCTCRRCESF